MRLVAPALLLGVLPLFAPSSIRAVAIVINDSDVVFNGTIDNVNCTRPDAAKEELVCGPVMVPRAGFPINTTGAVVLTEPVTGAVSDAIRLTFELIPFDFVNQNLRVDFQSDPDIFITSNRTFAELVGGNQLTLADFGFNNFNGAFALTVFSDPDVPEPGTFLLLGSGLAGLAYRGRRSKRL